MVPSLCSELVYCVLQWTVSTVQRRCCVPGCLLSAWRPWPDLLNPLFHTIISFSSGVLRSKTQSWRSTSSPQMGKNAAVLFFCFVFFPVFSVFNFEWNTSSSLYMRCFKDTNNPSTLPPFIIPPSSLLPPPSSHYCIDAVTSLGGDVTGSVELEHPYQRQWDERESERTILTASRVWRSGRPSKKILKKITHNRGHISAEARRGEGRPGGGWACRVRDAVGARWVEPGAVFMERRGW